MKSFILFLSLISYSLAQSPTVYRVDSKSGNDSNNGLTQGTAFKTVQYAFESNNYSAGDTIKVMPSLNASGNLSYYDFGGDELRNLNKNFILVGVKGADSTIFDAESKNRHMTIEGQTLDASKIIGITFRNGNII